MAKEHNKRGIDLEEESDDKELKKQKIGKYLVIWLMTQRMLKRVKVMMVDPTTLS